MQQRAGRTHPRPYRGARPGRPRFASRRVLWTAFAVSAAIHGALALLYPVFFGPLDPDALAPPPNPYGTIRGIEVVRIGEAGATSSAERPEDPIQLEEPEAPVADTEAPDVADGPVVEIVPPPMSAAERLRPRLGDRRLWGPLDPAFTELTLEQREELILADRLDEWYDSVNAAAAAEAALTDWTYTDGDGGRWGVSPGQLHLGSVTLPLPFAFGTLVGKRDETNRRLWEWEEITRQGSRVEIEESWKERAEAIRARRDRERARARPDTSGVRR